MNIIEHTCHSYCEICGKDLSERIKVLEDAIEEIAECDSFFGRIELKNKALEVKP